MVLWRGCWRRLKRAWDIEMRVAEALQKRRHELMGKCLTVPEGLSLSDKLGSLLPPWYLEIVTAFPLIGCEFDLAEADDLSALGVEMVWMDDQQMLSEAVDAF